MVECILALTGNAVFSVKLCVDIASKLHSCIKGSFYLFMWTIPEFFKENVRYPVWTCRDPISLFLGTRFSLILGTRFSILGTRIGSLKHLKKTLDYTMFNKNKDRKSFH